MAKGYFTLKTAAEGRFTERRSEFIGNARPVSTEAEAVDFVNSIRSKYSDATHNVYAYILREGNLARFSDDGEPHGTAGLPVLEVLRKEALCDCAVVVTRYFGGILLGAGGLVRAYSAGAKLGIDCAQKIFLKPFSILEAEMDYGRYNRFVQLMSLYGVRTDASNFAESVSLRLSVPEERAAEFTSAVTDATNGIVAVRTVGTKYDYES